jgi:sulfoxide reductase heme-binding subunit YedZ
LPARVLSALVWIAIALPALWIAAQAARGALGANPVETLERETGAWTLRLLLATLAVTPLRRLAGWQAIAKHRRRLGLAAFAYAAAHFATWAAIDNGLAWRVLVEDVVERPFVTMGFAAFVLLVPLAVTSTRASIRRLGKRWVALHRLVYVAAVLAIVHFWWLVKKDVTEPAVYAGIVALLLGARLVAR